MVCKVVARWQLTGAEFPVDGRKIFLEYKFAPTGHGEAVAFFLLKLRIWLKKYFVLSDFLVVVYDIRGDNKK